MYDATILLAASHKNAERSGVFWTAYNIAHILNKKKNIKLIFYIEAEQIDALKDAVKTCMPEFHDVQIWARNTPNYFDNTINFWGNLKSFAKREKHKIIAEIFHITGFLVKLLFLLPRKLVKLKNNKVNADIFLSPVFKVPDFLEQNNKIKKYTVLYDIMPFLFPEYYPSIVDKSVWIWRLRKLMARASQDKYFSISACTKKDWLKLVPELKSEQITVTPLACADNFHPCDKNATLVALKKYNLPTDKKYVFSLCSLEPRKNLIRSIKTFIEFIKKNKIDDMVFIMGGGHWDLFIKQLESEIKDLGKYKNKIIKAGYIDDEDLAPLYSGAEWFVYTSEYEGFGLPPLEAMACGVPVITSNHSSLPEVVGQAGIMIDWDNDDQHVAAYEKYYFDEKYRAKMAEAGLKRAKNFSWDKTVDIMLDEMLNNK